MSNGPSGSNKTWNWARRPYDLAYNPCCLIAGHDNALRSQVSLTTQTLCPIDLKIYKYVPFRIIWLPGNDHRSFGNELGESLPYTLAMMFQGPSCLRLSPLLQEVGSRLENWLMSRH